MANALLNLFPLGRDKNSIQKLIVLFSKHWNDDMLCNSLLSGTREMGPVVTAGYIQFLQSEESNSITASVPAQPITEVRAALCVPGNFSFSIITIGAEASSRLIFMLIAFLQCAL